MLGFSLAFSSFSRPTAKPPPPTRTGHRTELWVAAIFPRGWVRTTKKNLFSTKERPLAQNETVFHERTKIRFLSSASAAFFFTSRLDKSKYPRRTGFLRQKKKPTPMPEVLQLTTAGKPAKTEIKSQNHQNVPLFSPLQNFSSKSIKITARCCHLGKRSTQLCAAASGLVLQYGGG